MPQELLTLADLLTRPEFLAGLGAGALATVGVAAARRPEGRGWGLALTAATLVGLSLTVGQRLSLVVGLVLLAAGGWLLDRPGPSTGQPYNPGWPLIVAGAILVALRGGLSDLVWPWVVGPVVIVGFGSALGLWRTGPHRHLLGPMVLVTAFGIWATVPNTDTARVLLGASTPLALATVRPIAARIGPAGAFALAGLLVAIAIDGGQTRPASIVGAWASIGLLALLPLTVVVTGTKPRLSGAGVLVGHALLVLVASRVVGLRHDALPAAAGVVVLWLIGAFVAMVVGPPDPGNV